MTITVATAQADIQTAENYIAVAARALALLPGIVDGVKQLLPAGDKAAADAVENFLKGALAWEGHAAEVIEAIWPQIKPLIMIALTLSGNAAAAAIVNVIPA